MEGTGAMECSLEGVDDPGATDLARAWEKSGMVRRRASLYHMALELAIGMQHVESFVDFPSG